MLAGTSPFLSGLEGLDVPFYNGQPIPAGAFDSFKTGVVAFDLEWNVTASEARPRPNGGGNGKVAVLVLAKIGDDSTEVVEACVVQLSRYDIIFSDDNFPKELCGVFTSEEASTSMLEPATGAPPLSPHPRCAHRRSMCPHLPTRSP